MIIKRITIENYLCYYGIKEFDLEPGLNIILGENGEGKTKFFEAVDWLLNGQNNKLDLLVSAKKLSEVSDNESFLVRVSILIEQYGTVKRLTRSFDVKKLKSSETSISNYMFEGIEENKEGERSQVDGDTLLERVFPVKIRRYSLFKGEAELNIFKNTEALGILINSFSSAKYYEKYSEKGAFLREKAEKAVDDVTRSGQKNQQEYKRLETEILKLGMNKNKIQGEISNLEDQIKKTEENIQDADKYVANAEALETINSRIKNIEEQIANTSNKINENYTLNLFDENWILVNFEKVFSEYSDKISKLNNTKRSLQSDFDKQIGINEGKNQLKAEILNNSVPLPVNVPSRAYMEEMLKDELCKFCNRHAKKGSEAYNFMLKRLEELLKSQEPSKAEEAKTKVLFKHNYMDRLFSLSVAQENTLSEYREIKGDIKSLFEFNAARKNEIELLTEKLNKELNEREKIIGTSIIGEDKLSNVLKNYKGWHVYLKHSNRELSELRRQMESIENELKNILEKKDNLDTKTANTFLLKTREVLRDIELIFNETKNRKFDEFIALLQSKSNNIFERINIDSFTGNIQFTKHITSEKTTINIDLNEGDKIFHKPNQSLLTSMHISILFAISELAIELQEESYPLIFDAPTSSFGETKTAEFLNLIYETENQKILLLKDFLVTNKSSKSLSVKKEFVNVKRDKAFWIRLVRPFDKNNLKSINTEIITL